MTPKEVFDVLVKIGAKHLHHANTVTTSCTFLEHGALLSRAYVQAHGLKQTPQDSDSLDKRFGIWDRVFVDHVDIHYRGGRKKGPNQYGPVLFIFDLDILLELPKRTEVGVTRTNPVHWRGNQKDADRWYLTRDELQNNIGYGDFDKMLVITASKVDFPNKSVRIQLDDPKRQLSTGAEAYAHAHQRLKAAAKKGALMADITPHECRDDCICTTTYRGYDASHFDSKFA